MFPDSGWRDQKLPLPGLSGVRGTFTKQSLKDKECLKQKNICQFLPKNEYNIMQNYSNVFEIEKKINIFFFQII